MQSLLPLLAIEDSTTTRLIVCGVSGLVGVLLIVAGINNIRTNTAEETGARRLVNQALDRSNTYEGSKAVAMGVMRIVAGVLVAAFGVVYVFVGPFLAN